MGLRPIPQNVLCFRYLTVTNETVTGYQLVSRETLTEHLTMALTNAERQAAFKARKAETLEALAQQNAALLAEVSELRAEVDRLREKAHRLEVAALKAQIAEAKRPAATPPKSSSAQAVASAGAPAKRRAKRAG